MSKRRRTKDEDTMRPEYDFSGGVRGKYAKRFEAGTNIVVLDPDVAARFPDSASVNEGLRALMARPRRRRSGA